MAYAPIQNPTYIDATEWPYIKGPNYTRPVFREHSRQGNFRVQPIIRMPALSAFGQDPVPTPPPSALTPEGICALIKQNGDTETYGKCIEWNRTMTADMQAHPEMSAQYVKALEEADRSCSAKLAGTTDTKPYFACYYGLLDKSPWYKNPYYLAGAIAGGAAAIALLVAKYRGQLQG